MPLFSCLGVRHNQKFNRIAKWGTHDPDMIRTFVFQHKECYVAPVDDGVNFSLWTCPKEVLPPPPWLSIFWLKMGKFWSVFDQPKVFFLNPIIPHKRRPWNVESEKLYLTPPSSVSSLSLGLNMVSSACSNELNVVNIRPHFVLFLTIGGIA